MQIYKEKGYQKSYFITFCKKNSIFKDKRAYNKQKACNITIAGKKQDAKFYSISFISSRTFTTKVGANGNCPAD